MAGDWIKVEHATLDKPEVLRISELLGISRRETLGVLLEFWVWLDRNSRNASVTHMSRRSIDDVTHTPGFSACLVDVGWAEIDDSTGRLTISNWDRHNGSTAKSRALAKDRAQRFRNVSVTHSALPEKRREEKILKASMSGSQANADAASLLEFLNEQTGRHFRPDAGTLKPIIARLKDGFSVIECRAVIIRKCREWGPDDKMRAYLRPETLFNATKFRQYLGEVPPLEAVQ